MSYIVLGFEVTARLLGFKIGCLAAAIPLRLRDAADKRGVDLISDELNESVVFYALQAFVLLSVIGLAFNARRHRSIGPMALGSVSTAALFFAFYATFSAVTVYISLAGLCVASAWNYFISLSENT